MRISRRLCRIAVVIALLGAACAQPSPSRQPIGALRLSQVADQGDAERRSSMQLVLRGLESDADARPHEALSDYQTALRVDPGNPYAYLALARQHAYGRTRRCRPAARARAYDRPLGVERRRVGRRRAPIAPPQGV